MGGCREGFANDGIVDCLRILIILHTVARSRDQVPSFHVLRLRNDVQAAQVGSSRICLKPHHLHGSGRQGTFSRNSSFLLWSPEYTSGTIQGSRVDQHITRATEGSCLPSSHRPDLHISTAFVGAASYGRDSLLRSMDGRRPSYPDRRSKAIEQSRQLHSEPMNTFASGPAYSEDPQNRVSAVHACHRPKPGNLFVEEEDAWTTCPSDATSRRFLTRNPLQLSV